jgi:DNA-binding NarL/FixJ family response regulator
MKRARVLLADDHRIVAEGLRNLLEDAFDLVGTVGDGHALVEAAAALTPDVIVCDIAMPVLNGLDAVRQLKRSGATAKIVFLTMYADVHLVAEAFRAGASGYVLKHSAGDELVAAIRDAFQGRTYITPLLPRDVAERLTDETSIRSGGAPGITPRQRQVLQLVAEGRTMKEIAALLAVSTRTAETHKYQMMQALGCRTTADLVRYAVACGIVPMPSQNP